MNKLINIGTNTLLACAKNLLDIGYITQEQYDEVVKRNSRIDDKDKLDVVFIR